MFEQTSFEVLDVRRELGRVDETFEWGNEPTGAPWVIYVMGIRAFPASVFRAVGFSPRGLSPFDVWRRAVHPA